MTLTVAACGMLGDTGSVGQAQRLAVMCETDQALALLDKADSGGGLEMYIADLSRAGILRDAGRYDEAAKALTAYMARPENADTTIDEVEKSLREYVDGLRDERRKSTGTSTCP
jgi:hypothetical protein